MKQSTFKQLNIMENENIHLSNLKEIRSIMERSSQFLSLSGLAGVFAGGFALLGFLAVFIYKYDFFFGRYYSGGVILRSELISGSELKSFIVFISLIGISVLFLALLSAFFFTSRNAKRKGLPLWNSSSKRMIINLFIPLVTGGFFSVALLYHGLVYLIAPTTLVFYGLALVNASKYTLRDIRYLGISEALLGVVASFIVGYGLIFWAIGFGVLHILYGFLMYIKYERTSNKS